MMSKKKRIINLEREVNTLQNNLDLSQKAGIATAGGLAIISIASLINSVLTKKKVKSESAQVADAISGLASLLEGASVSVAPKTEVPSATDNDTTSSETKAPVKEEEPDSPDPENKSEEKKADEEESKEDDSKQPKVQLIGSFSGPELQSQISMFAEFLSMIKFDNEYKISLQTLKSASLLFIAEADDNLSISHMEPSYILDGDICGDNGLYFIIYLPDCKIKVSVNDEVIEISEI